MIRIIAIILLSYVSHITLNFPISRDLSSEENIIVHEEEKALMVLTIPKIKFKGNIYSKKSNLNDIDKNIIIMNESDYPDKDNGIVIIGGHSGIGELAYFKDLNKLVIGDDVTIEYNEEVYSYILVNSYLDDKNGSIMINNSNGQKKLFLYTCNPHDKKNYLILVFESNS